MGVLPWCSGLTLPPVTPEPSTPDAGLMLGQRRRRWTNISPESFQYSGVKKIKMFYHAHS